MFVLVSRKRTLNLFIFYPILIIILYDFIWVCELELFYFLKIFVENIWKNRWEIHREIALCLNIMSSLISSSKISILDLRFLRFKVKRFPLWPIYSIEQRVLRSHEKLTTSALKFWKYFFKKFHLRPKIELYVIKLEWNNSIFRTNRKIYSFSQAIYNFIII